MSKPADYAELDFDECRDSTDGAVLLDIDGKHVWVPRSVIEPDEMPEQGDRNTSTFVRVWFAEKEGLV